MRSRAFASSPIAIASATRIRAIVRRSTPPCCSASCVPRSAFTITAPHPNTGTLSPLQPPIHTQVADRLAAPVGDRLGEERLGRRSQPQVGDHRRHGPRRGRAVPVLPLPLHAEPPLGEKRAVHALSATLCDHPA